MIREVLRMDIGIFPPPFDLEDYSVRGAEGDDLHDRGNPRRVPGGGGLPADHPRWSHRDAG